MDNNTDIVQAVIDRMKTVLGVTTDKEVSLYFGGSRSAAGVWKTRGRIPILECIQLAQERGVSLDWLVLGRPQTGAQCAPAAGDGEGRQALYADLVVWDLGNFFSDVGAASWSVPRAWLAQELLAADDTILVRLDDDSMRDTIGAGQLVVVDQRPRVGDGVYLVRFGDQVRVKRVQHMADGTIRLSSDNPKYAAETIAAGAEGFLILGYCHAAIAAVS